ncbi:hypothetical protein [Allosalinactinospora lopnorensis]|uniref:hypothetical protein n=1 Tax=Allosalinactinospora lopnorensis TaxID=1352348 RepID=UPI000623F220|nr:hypothetical protein [Allosalinactinospora lopnorensis]
MSSHNRPIGAVRRSLLARLQQEVHRFGRSALVALAGSDHPVLYTVGPDGRRVAVVALWLGDSWWFVWSHSSQVRADCVGEAAAALAGHGPAGNAGNVRARVRGERSTHVASGALAGVA